MPRVLAAAFAAVAVTVSLIGASIGPAQAADAVPTLVPDPVPAVVAPATVEGLSPYVGQVSCDPTAKPGALALRSLLMTAYGGRDLGIVRACTMGSVSEHKEGRAFDWGLDSSVPAENAVARQAISWLLAPGPDGVLAVNARRLGIMYFIYNRQIWSSYRAAEGLRPYTGGESHATHIHISLAWNGATRTTSWWTGAAAAVDYGPCIGTEGSPAPVWSAPRSIPCPSPVSTMSLTGLPLLGKEATGPYVLQLQRLLSVSPVSGWFGPLTETALSAVQKARGLVVTGTTTPETWVSLRATPVPASAAPVTPAPAPKPVAPKPVAPKPVAPKPVIPKPATSTPPTTQPVAGRSLLSTMAYRVRSGDSLSRIAKVWRSSPAAIRSASKLRSDTLKVGQVVSVPVRSGLTKFTYTVIRKGNRGVAVAALQGALRMPAKYRTGLFGDITLAKVNAFKVARGWKADGVVGAGVWRALGA